MIKQWIVEAVEALAIGKLAKGLLTFLFASLFFSMIGVIALGYLIYRLAVKPMPNQFDQINSRLDRIERQLYNP